MRNVNEMMISTATETNEQQKKEMKNGKTKKTAMRIEAIFITFLFMTRNSDKKNYYIRHAHQPLTTLLGYFKLPFSSQFAVGVAILACAKSKILR